MSGHEGNVNALTRQLMELQMQQSPSQIKKVPPPPPPKKNRAQPQMPQIIVTEPSEQLSQKPSYITITSNNPLYGNIPTPQLLPLHRMYSNVSPQMPPPPTYYSHYDYNHNTERPLPPHSPVSSNYSELARATHPSYPQTPSHYPLYQNYSDYGSHTSTYESIYEPIETRAPSVMVLLPHNQCKSNSDHQNNIKSFDETKRPEESSTMSYGNSASDQRPLPKEKEVDALTQLLVQSIGEGVEADTYGVCVRCRCRVQGADAGCTAMDHIYHLSCFTCACCDASLQGKPFYAVDGQPHCENDYLQTLEKCSVCDEPIRDRILRATGKPYHPACFVCVACGKSLDGVPFTVDAANQIHCIEDFHAKFAPRCCVCVLPIMPEPGQEETVRVVALDRSFHVKCYRCEDCGLLLSSEAEGRGCYPLDDHILCKVCNAQRVRKLTNVITTDL